mgnify:CR=1 FL=1
MTGSTAGGVLLEVCEMNDSDTRFDEAFKRPVPGDKIHIQPATPSIEQ